ncbi:variable surface lipoprotein [Besnoitia besnoiti]|uniref:Variable surface lipoprotein n=1 Tax=Besnoitia besnoiti TaxID=94643 RepID=A0A2A9MAA4_BESBE|nr:variable surface lipoprotein [Besnoitia besnoiti]PFH32866.1 variable surface lipoprotein [Besnoitia besnoiti]
MAPSPAARAETANGASSPSERNGETLSFSSLPCASESAEEAALSALNASLVVEALEDLNPGAEIEPAAARLVGGVLDAFVVDVASQAARLCLTRRGSTLRRDDLQFALAWSFSVPVFATGSASTAGAGICVEPDASCPSVARAALPRSSDAGRWSMQAFVALQEERQRRLFHQLFLEQQEGANGGLGARPEGGRKIRVRTLGQKSASLAKPAAPAPQDAALDGPAKRARDDAEEGADGTPSRAKRPPASPAPAAAAPAAAGAAGGATAKARQSPSSRAEGLPSRSHRAAPATLARPRRTRRRRPAGAGSGVGPRAFGGEPGGRRGGRVAAGRFGCLCVSAGRRGARPSPPGAPFACSGAPAPVSSGGVWRRPRGRVRAALRGRLLRLAGRRAQPTPPAPAGLQQPLQMPEPPPGAAFASPAVPGDTTQQQPLYFPTAAAAYAPPALQPHGGALVPPQDVRFFSPYPPGNAVAASPARPSHPRGAGDEPNPAQGKTF